MGPRYSEFRGQLSGRDKMLLGVDYYPDQTPESLWEEDSRMMADMGFTNVRIARTCLGPDGAL